MSACSDSSLVEGVLQNTLVIKKKCNMETWVFNLQRAEMHLIIYTALEKLWQEK